VKNKTASRIFLVLSILLLGYFITLQVISFSLFSFSFIWFIAGGVFLIGFIHTRRQSAEKRFVLFPSVKGIRRYVVQTAAAAVFLVLCINFFYIITPRIASGNETAQYMIILGGGVRQDGTLGQVPLMRIKTAAAYMKAHPAIKAIVSGGKLLFKPTAEAPVLAAALENEGISNSRILLENKAYDTIQNFSFSAAVAAADKNISIQAFLLQPVLIVTSDFHLARAERIARREGYTAVYGIPSPTPAISIPDAYLREMCAYIKLNLRILLTGRPARIY